ncbi:hypothetical protein RchiOBHm_Chr4g0403431 [Rosa chinensis]|uniref:Uncharacterized protein n=1 Tax=Rosa chinensis TaxID=74649 RepID=A0A2P6QTL5_ROSCH|nr:hypothetical protein RchiOBHm_Chr4g0403431 [Rosa chinensis]
MIVTTGSAILVHLLLCWLHVYKTSLGYRGVVVAISISYWINALLLAIYIRVSPSCIHTWTRFSKEAFHRIPNFIRLSIPSAIMIRTLNRACAYVVRKNRISYAKVISEKWKLLFMVDSINLNFYSGRVTFSFSLSFPVTRVSNQLGAGQPRLARLAVGVSLCIVVAEGVVVAAVLILGRTV